MNLNIIMIAILGCLMAYFIIDWLSNADTRSRKRKDKIITENARGYVPSATDKKNSRSKAIQDSLDEIERRQNSATKAVPMNILIKQAGKDISVGKFYIFSAIFGVCCAALMYFVAPQPLLVLATLFVAGLGFPKWYLLRLRNKRMNAFIEYLPDAIEVIVRGIKSGLPVIESMRIVAEEAEREIVRKEFKQILEHQALGMPLVEAVNKLYERIPRAEANFFGIAIGIQQKTGGNLAETLQNLAKVLRDRKLLKQKIQAMIAEAKVSGVIVGGLPFAVALIVYAFNPDYMEILWTTDLGMMLLMVAIALMSTTLLIMYKLVNFDY